MGAGDEEQLVTTLVAARALGINPRTLQRYVTLGWVEPAVTLPSGHHRWRVGALMAQMPTSQSPTG